MMTSSIITPYLPDNLQRLHGEEERIRAESSLCINSKVDLKAHVKLFHSCLDMLHAACVCAPQELSDNEQVIHGLSIRLFDSGSCFLKLLLSGYYQGAIAFLRDIVEVGFLLDYFDFRPQSIEAWRNGEKNEFKPVKIREALDERDGYQDKGRAERYNLLSNYGTHATFNGFKLIANDNKLTIGPFMNEEMLAGILFDGAMHFPHAVLTCLMHHNGMMIGKMEKSSVDFLERIAVWFREYRDPNFAEETLKQVAELREGMTK